MKREAPNTMDYEKLEKKIRDVMDARRFRHTLGVAYTASAMAMAYGVDMEKAYTAGLLHDCAKQLGNEKLIKLSEKFHLDITVCEKANPFLLHAKVGAALSEKKYHISDPDIISAVRWHTTGHPHMTPLEQIIFLSDYIEPGRKKAEDLPLIRKAAFRNLDECCFLVLRSMLDYLKQKGGEIDQETEKAYEFYKLKNKEMTERRED